MKTMAAGSFKAKCLAVMDEVQAKRETVVITKRGKPVAKLDLFSQNPRYIQGPERLSRTAKLTDELVSALELADVPYIRIAGAKAEAREKQFPRSNCGDRCEFLRRPLRVFLPAYQNHRS